MTHDLAASAFGRLRRSCISPARRIVLLMLAASLAAVSPACGSSQSQRLAAVVRRCRHILKKSLVDFYLPGCVDAVNGGYLESLREGRFAATGEKFLTLQGRQLWFFSTLALNQIELPASSAAAKSGFDFLEAHFRDRQGGGYFSKVTDAGEPKDTRKHVYLNAFALYGLVAYHSATKSPEAHRRRQGSFSRPGNARARRPKAGGYIEFFDQSWRAITDPREPPYVGAIGTKTYNTHLHVLEALAALYRVWPDPLVRQRMAEMITINTQTVRHPEHFCNVDGWQTNWRMIETPANLRASYGHDVECAWLTLDAARAIGMPQALLRSWAESLCGYSLRFGYDRTHGGFFYTGPLGRAADDTRKEWWVEAEALVSMLEMYRLTGKSEYLDVFRQTLEFVEQHQVAAEGGWWATRRADGSPQSDPRSSPWHGAYHSGRAMLLSAQILESLAATSDPLR